MMCKNFVKLLSNLGFVLATWDIRSEKMPTEHDYLSVLARKHETSLQSESIALFSNSPFFRQMLQVASTRHFPTSVR
jgi:ABC-type Fe2+-enterobactin transport system substrate-binding protein